MYCKACLDIFKVYRRRSTESHEPIMHQVSATAVLDSSRHGCDICCRLWEQFVERISLGTECFDSPPSTSFMIKPVIDRVQSRSGRSSTSPPRESLSSSGLDYTVEFLWNWMEREKYRFRPFFLQYRLIDSQSTYTAPRLY